LSKQIARKPFSGKKTLYLSEDRFNNFSTLSPINNSPDFKKHLSREFYEKLHSKKSIESIDIEKANAADDRNKFNQTAFKCYVNYAQTERKTSPRLTPEKKELK
jgi:hypothetical protein